MQQTTYANPEVLNFYKSLPFNCRSNLEEEINAVYKRTTNDLYPGLSKLLGRDVSVLEIGCGTGWLCNSISYLFNASVTGIDFNPVAINIAKEVAKAMKLSTSFSEQDLFLYEPLKPFDVVISFGVLHHTNNCKLAVRILCEKFVRCGGHVMIGLYHKYGRQPFLEYFNNMKINGATEEDMLKRYRQLQSHVKDDRQILSWFYDQVLHPYETQHTLEEMLPVLDDTGMDLISTSINHFKPIKTLKELIDMEKEYYEIAMHHLKNKQYFPGFFIFLAQKKGI
ncbi:MAG: class I SAM-dependent methyltransferase [Candidatus Hydrogenedentota bacterium]